MCASPICKYLKGLTLSSHTTPGLANPPQKAKIRHLWHNEMQYLSIGTTNCKCALPLPTTLFPTMAFSTQNPVKPCTVKALRFLSTSPGPLVTQIPIQLNTFFFWSHTLQNRSNQEICPHKHFMPPILLYNLFSMLSSNVSPLHPSCACCCDLEDSFLLQQGGFRVPGWYVHSKTYKKKQRDLAKWKRE